MLGDHEGERRRRRDLREETLEGIQAARGSSDPHDELPRPRSQLVRPFCCRLHPRSPLTPSSVCRSAARNRASFLVVAPLTKHSRSCIYTIVNSDFFQILADPTRRRIVEVLLEGEQQVGDVVDRAGVHQSGVSRHLRILHEAGFVSMRPDGQRRLYALRGEPFREMEVWLAPYRKIWEARLDRFGAALEREGREARRSSERSTKE
ncbi:MAG: winged helix-turn-helix transcriptional regulator [Deltaproteobacteria bacterium]|nr:winged helix-turn-helix transcriptional regulator [Deltaproteobacteria bacterium]